MWEVGFFDSATGHFVDLKLIIGYINGSIRHIYSIAKELRAGLLKCMYK